MTDLTNKHPAITWSSVAGATAYRLHLVSRVPNGRIVASLDTIIAQPRFFPPKPLADHRAKVVVRLATQCGDEVSAEAVSWFQIDTSATCKLAQLDVSAKGTVSWRPVSGAESYDIKAFGLVDGILLATRETRSTFSEIDLHRQPAVIIVRPLCRSGEGEAVYRIVAAP